MKYLLLFTFAYCLLVASDDSFINRDEYGRHLYMDPRGIGCNVCHGDDGRGRLIAEYRLNNGEGRAVVSPDITGVDYQTFVDALIRGKSLMPKYHLTDDEIEAIYDYINAR